MANNTDQLAVGAIPALGLKKGYVQEKVIDLAGLPTGELVYVFTIPKGQKVLDVVTEVVEGVDLVATANVGIYSDKTGTAVDADGFNAAVDLDAAEGTIEHGLGGTDALMTTGGYMHATAETYIALALTVAAGPVVAGSIAVRAHCVDLS